MKARNDKTIMRLIRVKRRAVAAVSGNFTYAMSFASEGRVWARAERVGNVIAWATMPPPRSGSLVISA